MAVLLLWSGPWISQAEPEIAWMVGGQGGPPHELEFSSSGTLMLSFGGQGSPLKLWSMPGGRIVRSFSTDGAVAIALSADGRRVATGQSNGSVFVWDAETGELLKSWAAHPYVSAVCFSPDSRMLATSSGLEEISVKIWSVPEGKLLHTLLGHTGAVGSVSFTPDGQTLISTGNEIRLWDVASGTNRKTIAGEFGYGRISSSGNVYAAWSGRSVVCYRIPEWTSAGSIETGEWFHKFAISAEAELIATAGQNRNVRLWDSSTGGLLREIPVPGVEHAVISSLTFTSDNKRLLTGVKAIEEWDVETGAFVREISTLNYGVTVNQFAPSGDYVIVADSERLRVYDSLNGESLSVIPRAGSWISFSEDGQDMRSGDLWWRLPGLEPIIRETPETDWLVSNESISPDGSHRATAEGLLILRRTSDSSVMQTISAELPIVSCAFSPDGSMIAGALRRWHDWYHGAVRVWRVSDGAVLYNLTNETYHINNVAWSKKNVLTIGRMDATLVAVRMDGIPWPTEVKALSSGDGSVLKLQVLDKAGKTLRLERTDDFVEWTEWTNTVTTGAEQVFEYPLGPRAEFFRAVAE
jgi:WD40 repeat protein